jgi:hypothetical protein
VDFDHMTDIWAFCVLRLVIRHSNMGDPDNILYDHPLGWWDSDWPGSHNAEGCYTNDGVVNDTYFLVCLLRANTLHRASAVSRLLHMCLHFRSFHV